VGKERIKEFPLRRAAIPSCEPFLTYPTVPLRGLAGRCSCAFCHRWACRPPDVCCSEEIEKRLAAPLGEQLRDLGVVLAPGWARELSSLFQDGRPEDLLLALPLRAVLKQMLARLNLNRHHQQLASGRRVVHARCCPVRQFPALGW